MSIVTPLSGHTSEQTALVRLDYPFGASVRCAIRYWIETKSSKGQRACSQTTHQGINHQYTDHIRRDGQESADDSMRMRIDEGTVVWNKPKKSTYVLFAGQYLDENDHVQWRALTGFDVDNPRLITEFRRCFRSGMGERCEAAFDAYETHSRRRYAGMWDEFEMEGAK